MPDAFATPVHNQKGPYNSAAHESLRAVARSLIVYFGEPMGRYQAGRHTPPFCQYPSELTPDEAREARISIERQYSFLSEPVS